MLKTVWAEFGGLPMKDVSWTWSFQRFTRSTGGMTKYVNYWNINPKLKQTEVVSTTIHLPTMKHSFRAIFNSAFEKIIIFPGFFFFIISVSD